MATVYSLVCENGSAGTYWTNLSSAEKLRYGDPGSERVYGGLMAALSAMTTANPIDLYTVEIADAFLDTSSAICYINTTQKPASILITTKVKGAYGAGFHFGNVSWTGSDCYVFNCTANWGGIRIERANVEIEGITVASASAGNWYNFYILSPVVSLKSCISTYGGTVAGGTQCCFAIGNSTGGFSVENCIAHIGNGPADSTMRGFFFFSGTGRGARVANCLAVGGGTTGSYGFMCQSTTNMEVVVINCAAIGWSVNWDTDNYPTSSPLLTHNIGETGSVPWDNTTTSITGLTSADFANFATDDYSPSATSLLIGAGTTAPLVGPVDMVGDIRPNYNPDGEEEWDVGPFEYDHGNGLAPQQVTISITGIAEGSVLAMYHATTDAEIIAPTTIGATGEYSDTAFEYTADVPVAIYVRKSSSGTKYKPWKGLGTITSSGLNVVVSQVEDTIAI